MNAASRRAADPTSTDSQTTSGWDPFTVWRERVHKSRGESKQPATVAIEREPALSAPRLMKRRA